MVKSDVEYRSKYAVAAPLDAIANGNERRNEFPNIQAPQPIYSKWCYSKYMSAEEKGKLKFFAYLATLFVSFGIRNGMGDSSIALSDSTGDADSVFGKIKDSSKDYMYYCSKTTGQYETIYWDRFYFLQFFKPAECKVGEKYIGRESSEGYTAHFADNSGTYYEGYFFDDYFTGVRILPNGERFLGSLNIHSGYEGSCVFIKPNGDREYAVYQNGERTNGILLSENIVICGEWRNGQLNGSGFIMKEDGCNFGDFRNGVLIG